MRKSAAVARIARAKRLARNIRYRTTPKGKFAVHKENSRRRGVPFLFTFDTWWQVWNESGKWDERGARGGAYVMCRIGDEGPYSPGNVYIGLHEANTAERNVTYRVRKRHTRNTTTVIFETDRSIYGAATPPF